MNTDETPQSESAVLVKAADVNPLLGEDIPLSVFWSRPGLQRRRILEIVKAIGIEPAHRASGIYVSLEDCQDIQSYLNAVTSDTSDAGKVIELLREHRLLHPRPKASKTSGQDSLAAFIADNPEMEDLSVLEEGQQPKPVEEKPGAALAVQVDTRMVAQAGPPEGLNILTLGDMLAASTGRITEAIGRLKEPSMADKFRDLIFLAGNSISTKTSHLTELLGTRPVSDTVYFERFLITRSGKQGKAQLWAVTLV